MTLKHLKNLSAVVIVLVIFIVGYIVPKIFINEPFGVRDSTFWYHVQSDGQTKKVYFCGGSEEDPDILVAKHFDNPIQRLLTVQRIFMEEDLTRNKNIYKAYTFFGIPISTVELDCKTGSIQTIKGL